MFWKIALVVVLPLLLYGRPALFRHPLMRLLSPRPIPSGTPAKGATAPAEPKRSLSRVYIALLALAGVALASWILTRALIDQPSAVSASAPDQTAPPSSR